MAKWHIQNVKFREVAERFRGLCKENDIELLTENDGVTLVGDPWNVPTRNAMEDICAAFEHRVPRDVTFMFESKDEKTQWNQRIRDLGWSTHADGLLMTVHLPGVGTEGERELHLSRLNKIKGEIDNARKALAMKEVKANLRRFAPR